jgi:hypothetical protein
MCRAVYPVETEIIIRFRRSGTKSDLITMIAVVRSCEPPHMGLQFANVKPSEHPKLMTTIAQLLANRPMPRGGLAGRQVKR